MFSLFKKKESAKVVKYTCLGVKYNEEGISQADLDSCFEVAEIFKTKVYTPQDIQEINNRLGFDTNDYYVWIDNDLLNTPNNSVTIKLIYRYMGSKLLSGEALEKAFLDKINPDLYYTRVDIENLSEEIGCDVFERNNFVSYTWSEHTYQDQNLVYKCINKQKSE